MARPVGMSFEFPDIDGLAAKFRELPKSLASAAIGAGVKRAMKPAQERLKATTPVGPTGNLRRGVATKAKRYPQTGAAVAIVGYRKAGSKGPPKEGVKRRNKAADKTKHQFLVEYGSKQRFTKSGANRGRMPAKAPVQMAWRAAESQVAGLLTQEMKTAYENALKQLPKFLAARAKKGRA
jgi:hypothetical protein